MATRRQPSTPKALISTAPHRPRFGNIVPSVVTIDGEAFVAVRVGTTGITATLTPDNARKLADRLHDNADTVDTYNEKDTTA